MIETGVPVATGHGLLRIPTRYVRVLLLRGLAIWVLARLMVHALYGFIAGLNRGSDVAADFTRGNPLILAGWTLVLSATLLRFDLHRRHEIALLNNLGVILSRAVALGTVPSCVMEAAMALLR